MCGSRQPQGAPYSMVHTEPDLLHTLPSLLASPKRNRPASKGLDELAEESNGKEIAAKAAAERLDKHDRLVQRLCELQAQKAALREKEVWNAVGACAVDQQHRSEQLGEARCLDKQYTAHLDKQYSLVQSLWVRHAQQRALQERQIQEVAQRWQKNSEDSHRLDKQYHLVKRLCQQQAMQAAKRDQHIWEAAVSKTEAKDISFHDDANVSLKTNIISI